MMNNAEASTGSTDTPPTDQPAAGPDVPGDEELIPVAKIRERVPSRVWPFSARMTHDFVRRGMLETVEFGRTRYVTMPALRRAIAERTRRIERDVQERRAAAAARATTDSTGGEP